LKKSASGFGFLFDFRLRAFLGMETTHYQY